MELLCYIYATMELIRNLADIGAVLRQERERRGKKPSDITAALGTQRSTLRRIEKGETNPTWDTVLGIAQVLDLEPVLIPRERLRAIEAMLRMTDTASVDEAGPLAGEEW